MKILITGGAGFIGSHVVRLFVNKYPQYEIFNIDSLTYAGNLSNLADIENKPNYTFIKEDITNASAIFELFKKYKFDGVIHLAAETHVDRSINDPSAFLRTNILGTMNLLSAARKLWENAESQDNNSLQWCDMSGSSITKVQKQSHQKRFYHISTDEVYGTLGESGLFTEETAYDPRSPYSASKASSDHIVRAFYHTYDLPVVISNCSNNYGPNQFPEKLIPLMINNIKLEKPLPIYGDGKYTRDWLWVHDHARAIDLIFHEGKLGETYNIGGHNEWQNIDLVHELIKVVDELLGREPGHSEKLITYVKDRAGHDRRYAIDATKIQKELGFKPSITFEEGLRQTAKWYLENEEWLKGVTSGDYQKYYEEMYS